MRKTLLIAAGNSGLISPLKAMMTDEGLAQLTHDIMALGYDCATAGHYAALIGDTPCFDGDGRIVIQDDQGHELARLRLRSLSNARASRE
ncbi:MAG TPA: hypothetical protein VKV04_20140 [Verrucomicrobiae bacterium]|nr:hypothetical protein [Verrucomicrobiae bacterium]